MPPLRVFKPSLVIEVESDVEQLHPYLASYNSPGVFNHTQLLTYCMGNQLSPYSTMM